MKILLLLLLPIMASSQTLKNDTLSYQGKSFYVGKEVKLSYGSNTNKDFVFVFIGSGMNGVQPASARLAKSTLTIDKVYEQKGKFFIRGKMEGIGLSKCFINIEGAIDFKELSD